MCGSKHAIGNNKWKTPRSEAYFSGDTKNKSFEATYQVEDGEKFTIFQQFNTKTTSPSIRVSVDGNRLTANLADGSPKTIATFDRNQPFTMNVQDMGNGQSRISVSDLSGKELGSGTYSNTRGGSNQSNNQFRYGLYVQGNTPSAHVLVTDVRTNL